MEDKELKAMVDLAAALSPIQDDNAAMARVLRWAVDRFRTKTVPSGGVLELDGTSSEDRQPQTGARFTDFADFFAAAGPNSEFEKALVGAYWFQKMQGVQDIDSQSVNRELKMLGHMVANITDSFNTLMGKKPALVIQTRKEGSLRQSRKKYRLTNEGLKYVEGMLSGKGESSGEETSGS